MAFHEFTFTQPETQCEIMVDIDSKTGRIIDVYCYASDVPTIRNEGTGNTYILSAKPGLNPLFVHFVSKVRVLRLLICNGFLVSMPDTVDEYIYQSEILDLAVNKYSLPNTFIAPY